MRRSGRAFYSGGVDSPAGRTRALRPRIWALAGVLAAALLAPAGAQAATAFGLQPGNVLIRFDTATPGTIQSSTAISGLGANQTVRGIDFRPATGELYASTVIAGSMANSTIATYRIDRSTGAATLVGQSAVLAGASDEATGYDFIPRIDQIRYVNENDENARLDPNDGGIEFDATDLTPAATTTIVATAYDRNTPGSMATQYNVDRANSTLAVQGGPDGDTGQQADFGPGSLGFTLHAVNDGGFDITRAGTAYAALTRSDNLTRLYSVNLLTGEATDLGLIGNGQTEVRSLAILPDGDSDGVLDASDNCDDTPNPDQGNLDNDAEGDACDADDDGDGLPDATETQIGSNPRAVDTDGDVKPDGADACPTLAAATANGCPDPPPGSLEFAIGDLASRISLRTLRSRGLPLRLTPNRPAAFLVELLGRARGSRLARAGDIVLGERRLPLASGFQSIRVRVARSQRRRLRRRARLQLRVMATDASGITAVRTRRVRIR